MNITLCDEQIDKIVIDELKLAYRLNSQEYKVDCSNDYIEVDNELLAHIAGVLEYYMVPTEFSAFIGVLPVKTAEVNRKTNSIVNNKANSAEKTEQILRTFCGKCGGKMRHGVAIVSTWVKGMDDFGPDDEICTMSEGGPGKFIPCMKCQQCGFSTT